MNVGLYSLPAIFEKNLYSGKENYMSTWCTSGIFHFCARFVCIKFKVTRVHKQSSSEWARKESSTHINTFNTYIFMTGSNILQSVSQFRCCQSDSVVQPIIQVWWCVLQYHRQRGFLLILLYPSLIFVFLLPLLIYIPRFVFGQTVVIISSPLCACSRIDTHTHNAMSVI